MTLPAALAGVAVLLLAGCLPPAPAPIAPDNAIIGLTVTNRWDSVASFGKTPQWIHLVRWNDKEDITAQEEIVTTNFQRGNRTYLINAKPGRYSVIATSEVVAQRWRDDPFQGLAGGRGPGARAIPVAMRDRRVAKDWDNSPGPAEMVIETTYFSEPSIRQTTVEVKPGSFSFLGNLVVDRDVRISQGDRAQRHFHPLQNPRLLNDIGIEVIATQFHASRSTHMAQYGEKAAEEAFLARATGDFSDTAWLPMVQQRLQELRGY